MRSVYAKTVYDKRFFMLGWGVGLATLGALMTVFFPAMHQDGAIDALVASMPDAFKGLVGDLSDLSSFDTYLASQLFDIRLTLIVGIMAIILGLSLSVADEEKGELRTMLSLPLSRVSVLLQKWLGMVSILFAILVGLAIGTYALVPFVPDASIEPLQVAQLLGMTALMTIAFGTIPFSIGMATGGRALASGLSIVVIMGSFILSTFGQAVEWLGDYEIFSLLSYFRAVEIVNGVVDWVDVAVLGGVTVIFLTVALVRFRLRDIA